MAEEPSLGHRVERAGPNHVALAERHPARYVIGAPAGQLDLRAGHARDVVPIEAGHAHAARLSFGQHGFALLAAPTRVRDFHDEEEVLSLYWPEVESLLQAVLGASRAIVFDHSLRASRDRAAGPGAVAPGAGRFGWHARRSAARLVRDLLPIEAARLLRHRFAIVTLWRAAERPPLDPPRASGRGDAAAAEPIPWDLTVFGLAWDRPPHPSAPSADPDDGPRSQSEEALLVGHFDSAGRIPAHPSHDALQGRAVRPGMPPGEGIEVHALVFWEAGHPFAASPAANAT